MPRSIQVVMFDFGGVFTDSPFEAVARVGVKLGAAAGQIEAIMFGPYHEDTDHAWHRLERGEIELERAVREIAAAGAALDLEVNPVDILMNMGSGGLREVLVERVRALRDAGFATALVTNNVAEFRPHWRAMLPVDELFDLVVDSSEVGVRKPDPAIFQLALEGLGGVPPERALFLDDYPSNIAAAEALGIRGILVESELRETLAALDRLIG
ncbi:MAG: HAD family phosphatase [Deltaproteobacteria bacterium]|nr:HAD family phosphatase [Deltaproteobacteria bacterium]MBW2664737.1 HAD family phosphatase [Deltaproteobacteria bacterium]